MPVLFHCEWAAAQPRHDVLGPHVATGWQWACASPLGNQARLDPSLDEMRPAWSAHRLMTRIVAAVCVAVSLCACSGDTEPADESRFSEVDRLFQTLASNVRNQPGIEVIADIDHARLAAQAGSSMPPSHVLIWSDPALDAAILDANPLAAIDLPLRVLAFEDQATGKAAVIANRFDFIARRHALSGDAIVRERYAAAIAKALQGIPVGSIAGFASDTMSNAGLVTLDSPHDFQTTEALLMDVIKAQSDTVHFATVDFAERSLVHGVRLAPLRLILFGAPGPGGQAMSEAPTLGLDAFCQKLLVWQDSQGAVHVTFNDLLALAARQDVSAGLPLRVINRRIRKTFADALKP